MSRFFSFALACLLSVAASTAQATVLSDYLTFDGPTHHTTNIFGFPFQGGGEDALIDDSVSAFDNRFGLASSFDDGDVVWGILTFSEIDSSGLPNLPVNSPNQIAVVFAAKILNDPLTSGIDLVPIGDALDPLDLRNLLHPSVQNGLSDDTIATILSKSTADTAAEDPLNWLSSQTADVNDGFSTTNDWSWELTADMLGDDFFQFAGTLGGGIDRAALTITSNAFGATWLPVDVLDFDGLTHFGDITLDIGTVNVASGPQQTAGWTWNDNSNFLVNPVPEPGSMAVFGLLGAAAFARARRNKSKK